MTNFRPKGRQKSLRYAALTRRSRCAKRNPARRAGMFRLRAKRAAGRRPASPEGRQCTRSVRCAEGALREAQSCPKGRYVSIASEASGGPKARVAEGDDRPKGGKERLRPKGAAARSAAFAEGEQAPQARRPKGDSARSAQPGRRPGMFRLPVKV